MKKIFKRIILLIITISIIFSVYYVFDYYHASDNAQTIVETSQSIEDNDKYTNKKIEWGRFFELLKVNKNVRNKNSKKDLQFGFDYDIIYIEKLRKLLNLFKKMKGTLCSVGRVKGGKYGKNQIK